MSIFSTLYVSRLSDMFSACICAYLEIACIYIYIFIYIFICDSMIEMLEFS